MHIIRDDQIRILELDRKAKFERSVLQHVASAYPNDFAAMGVSGAGQLLRIALEFGAPRRIVDENGLIGLIGLFIEFGSGLELAPYRAWALSILDHPKLAGSLKVGLVRERLDSITQGRRIVLYEEP